MIGHGFKAQLKEALSRAVGYFQDGGDPNEACVKAANEAGFNADQADRLVETFNTARVICHYKVAEDKASSCSLADKETVRSQLTSHQDEKTAEYAQYDYGCYRQAEVDHVIRQKKEAEFELKEDSISNEAAAWLKEREVRTMRELAKEASEQARAAHSLANEIAEKVAHELSRDCDLGHVHDRMARIVRAYALDDRYAPGVEKVAEFLPSPSDPADISHLLKYAAQHIVDTSDLDGIMAGVKEASDLVAEASALEAYASEMDKMAQEAEQPLTASDLDGKTPDELKDMLLREKLLGENAKRLSARVPQDDSQAGGVTSGSGGKPSGGVGNKSVGGLAMYLLSGWKGNADADRESRISKSTDSVNNVRRQLILQDLLARDKVLSQEDPSRVVAAFRSVNQISPDSTLNKELLRGMLRSVVQSVAISPFDAKTLSDLDKTRRQAYDPKAKGGNGND